MKLKIINNILSKNINRIILKELINHHWFIACDNQNDKINKIFLDKNNGFSITTISEGKIQVNSNLNKYGKIIFNTVVKKLKMNIEIDRFCWNMYLKNSDSEIHIDREDPKCISMLYNLHTTDGGTEINGKFYKDVESQIKIYNSNVLHKGIGPKKDNVRFNLNIVAKLK
jgi:hypothetical protein